MQQTFFIPNTLTNHLFVSSLRSIPKQSSHQNPGYEPSLWASIQHGHPAAPCRAPSSGIRMPDGGHTGLPNEPTALVEIGRMLHRSQFNTICELPFFIIYFYFSTLSLNFCLGLKRSIVITFETSIHCIAVKSSSILISLLYSLLFVFNFMFNCYCQHENFLCF